MLNIKSRNNSAFLYQQQSENKITMIAKIYIALMACTILNALCILEHLMFITTLSIKCYYYAHSMYEETKVQSS